MSPSAVRGPAQPRARRPCAGRRGPGMGTDDVQGVTTAPAPRSEDRAARMRVYLIQMALRTVCVIGAFFAHGWWQLALILGAVVLPYVAVVSVNASGPPAAGVRRDVPLAAPALTAEPAREAPSEPVVLSGEVVEDHAGPRRLTRGAA